MSTNFFDKRTDLLYIFIMGFVLFLIFRPVFADPEHYLFSDSGDGLKNYFVVTHYVRNDSGNHFSGMNYPYGEHVVFTDNQPILSFLLKAINNHIISMDNHIIGFLNIWMIFSIYLTGWFILLLLKRMGITGGFALVFTLLITFLSPQLERLGAHYALSYGFYIPAILYYLWRIFDRDKPLLSMIALGVLYLFAGMTHLYLMAINLLLIGSFVTIFWFLSPKRRPTKEVLFTLAIVGVITMGIVTWIYGSDNVLDRPNQPYGAGVYKSSFESVFWPHLGPLHDALHIGNQQWEGWNYVGCFGFCLLLVLIVSTLKRITKPKALIHLLEAKPHLYATLLSGVVALLYSAHFFHWIDVLGILQHLGPLGQFRSLGRFGWVFYYTFLIFGVYWLYVYFIKWYEKGKYNYAFLALLGTAVVWQHEAGLHTNHAVHAIFKPNRILTDRDHTYLDILQKADKKPQDFQAILLLPYVILGPEWITLEAGLWDFKEAARCSHQTGIPIMDIMMSRTSLRQSLDLMGLLGDLPLEKERLKHMDERPILLIADPDLLRPNEKSLLSKAQLLGHNNEFQVLELPVNRLRSNRSQLTEKYGEVPADTILFEQAPGFTYWDNFEKNKDAPVAFNGEGAKWVKDTTIFCVDIPKDSQFYEMSIWVYLDPKSDKKPLIYNDYSLGGDATGTQLIPLKQAVDVYGYWVRYVATVDSDKHLCLRIKGAAWVDGALVHPAHSPIIYQENGVVYYDSCPLADVRNEIQ